MKMYSTFDVEKEFGLNRFKMQEWIEKGYVTPCKKAEGKGTAALFSFSGVIGALTFDRLVRAGFTRKLAKKILEDK